MSVSKWRYTEACEGRPCPGDCDLCDFDPDEVTVQPPTIDYKWKDCVFCDHCTDVYWDYTHLIYAITCEEEHDPNDRPCKYFKEAEGE